MSKATIDFDTKEITLTIPYESAADMAAIIEVAENGHQKRADNLELERMENEKAQDVEGSV